MRVLLVAGEASGDLHGANLLQALREEHPTVEAFGIGGDRLESAGLECIARIEELSLMGFAEVVRELPRVIAMARRVRREALRRRPAVAVLIDAPDFNLPLASRLHRVGIPVVLYVSPQVWAWRSGRVRRIRRDVARVLCILPFEQEYFGGHRVDAEYVGHPLVDELFPLMQAPPAREPSTLALLPGSRWHEVSSLLPPMVQAAEILHASEPNLKVRVLVAPGLARDRLSSLVEPCVLPLEWVSEDRHRVLAGASVALVASGTATLECALLAVPMVVGYRVHPLTFFLARRLVRVPFIGLANLVAGRAVAPELVQKACTPVALASHAQSLMLGGGEVQREGLLEVRRRLGDPGASRRAAAAVLKIALGGV